MAVEASSNARATPRTLVEIFYNRLIGPPRTAHKNLGDSKGCVLGYAFCMSLLKKTIGQGESMKTTVVAGALLLVASSPSIAATCTSTVNWASLGPPGLEIFGNSFAAPGSFTDCYTFTLGGPSNSFGGVIELNTLFNKLDIDVTSVSLTGGNLSQALSDDSPLSFSFVDLLAGNYEFAVSGVVTDDPGLWKIPIGYAGQLTTIVDPTPATSVAEPATLSLFGLGLATIAMVRRRRAS